MSTAGIALNETVLATKVVSVATSKKENTYDVLCQVYLNRSPKRTHQTEIELFQGTFSFRDATVAEGRGRQCELVSWAGSVTEWVDECIVSSRELRVLDLSVSAIWLNTLPRVESRFALSRVVNPL
jgi:hypothetical protein